MDLLKVTYEFVIYNSHRPRVSSLSGPGRCSLECIPEKNFFHGGQPPWKCEGNYEADVISMTSFI